MRQDIETIKTTLTNHNARFDTLDKSVHDINERLGGHDRRFDSLDKTGRNVVVEQARARGDIEWLKKNMVTRGEYKAGMDQILGKLDGISGKLGDSRYTSAKNLDRLDEHERRIRAPETKPS